MSRLEVTGEPFLVVPDASPGSVSRDGTLAFVHRPPEGGTWQLVWLDRTGRRLDAIGAPRQGVVGPSLSADDRRLAFAMIDEETNNRDLWVRDLERGAETRLTGDEAGEFGFRWTPAGDEIVFTKWTEEEGLRHLSVPADGSRPEQPLGGGTLTDLAPDGLAAVVISQPEGDPARTPRTGPTNIVLAPRDSAERRPIVTSAARNTGARVSPDGRWLAFQSDGSGHEEVYLTRFPSGQGRWQLSVAGGRSPFWDPRGGRLYFLEKETLTEVEVADGDSPRLGKPTALFEVPSPRGIAVARDGERFVAVEPAGDAEQDEVRPGIKVVQNWVREFDSP